MSPCHQGTAGRLFQLTIMLTSASVHALVLILFVHPIQRAPYLICRVRSSAASTMRVFINVLMRSSVYRDVVAADVCLM
jgi:hypothetical protein